MWLELGSRWIRLAVALFGLIITIGTIATTGSTIQSAFADGVEQELVQEDVKSSLFRLGVLAEYDNFSYASQAYNGAGVGVLAQRILSESWALQGGFSQAFQITNGTPLFTRINLGIVYALSGTLIHEDREIRVGNTEVVSVTGASTRGWRLEALTNLYFFNSVSSLVALTGLGGAVYYEFPMGNSDRTTMIGARIDQVEDPRISLTPIQVFFGIQF